MRWIDVSLKIIPISPARARSGRSRAGKRRSSPATCCPPHVSNNVTVLLTRRDSLIALFRSPVHRPLAASARTLVDVVQVLQAVQGHLQVAQVGAVDRLCDLPDRYGLIDMPFSVGSLTAGRNSDKYPSIELCQFRLERLVALEGLAVTVLADEAVEAPG